MLTLGVEILDQVVNRVRAFDPTQRWV